MAIAEQDREAFEGIVRTLRDPITSEDKRRALEKAYVLGQDSTGADRRAQHEQGKGEMTIEDEVMTQINKGSALTAGAVRTLVNRERGEGSARVGEREVDRVLQKLRKAGRIEFGTKNTVRGWRAAPPAGTSHVG